MLSDFVFKLYSKESIKKTQTKLDYLGSKNRIDIHTFLTLRLTLSFILFLLPLFISNYYLVSLLLSISGYYLFTYYILDYRIKNRIKVLEDDSLIIFEMILLISNQGNSLKRTLKIISENTDNELSDEIKLMVNSIDCGKSFKESIDDILKFIPSINVRTVFLSLKDSVELGSSLNETVRNILEFLKEKKNIEINNKYNKIPVKFVLTTILIYIPFLLLVIYAPYFIGKL